MGYSAKIMVALPSHDYVPVMFAQDYGALMQDAAFAVAHKLYAMEARGEQCEIGLGSRLSAGTYVHTGRQELIDKALETGVTHILWLDTDMRFPPDSLVRLMNHNLPMVGINYLKRRLPPEFVAIKALGWNEGERSERLVTDEDATGLEEVDAVGFGMVMMQTAALADMPDPKEEPWFWFKWIPEKQMQVGEDVQFCRLFRESGQKIYVDHDLSKECGHIGLHTFRVNEMKVERPEAVAV